MLVAAIILIFGSGILDASPTLAAEPASSVIAGRASVIDGDTLEIHG
jgi:endonuclease YncB( thermonuclease family)